MTAQNNWITITGSIIGAIGWGVSGALIGGLIGTAIQEAIKCPVCGNIMKFINGIWKCETCGYEKKQ